MSKKEIKKRVAISREVVDLLDYTTDKGFNALLLYTVIKTHYEMSSDWFPIEEQWTVTLDGLFANFKIKLSKEDKSKLVEALAYLVELDIITLEEMPKGFAKEFVINPSESKFDKGNTYMLVRADELHQILTGKLAESRQELVTYVCFVSTVDGNYIHQPLDDLAERLTNKVYSGSEDASDWLVKLTKKEADELLKVVCWWNLDEICTHKHSKDESGVEWITRPTLNKVLKRLEAKGVIDTIEVLCKGFANKKVLCKSEHRVLIEAYYKRKDAQAQHEWKEEQEKAKVVEERESKPSANSQRRRFDRR